MTRVDGWPERLAQYVELHRTTPFAWGTHDCVSFAAGAVEAVTRAKVALPIWSDEAGARRLLDVEGGLLTAVSRRFDQVPVRKARRGDLMGIQHPDGGVQLAVCLGSTWCAPARGGLCFGETLEAFVAWRI